MKKSNLQNLHNVTAAWRLKIVLIDPKGAWNGPRIRFLSFIKNYSKEFFLIFCVKLEQLKGLNLT